MIPQLAYEQTPMGEPQSTRDAELTFLALLLRGPQTKADHGPTPDEDERENFHRALRNYYRATIEEMAEISVRTRSLDEAAVVLHMARHAALETREILFLREKGLGWRSLANWLHLSRESFYVALGSPTAVMPGAPYRHFEEKAREAWSGAGLSDEDIVSLINLKLLSEYYGCRPEHVIALRSTGWSFANIHGLLAEPGSEPPPKKRSPSQRIQRRR